MDKRFSDIISLILLSRNKAIRAVNVELINLYWNVGAYIKQKLTTTDWGDKTVSELANFIQENNPEIRGFSRAGLYRMIQFYESYAGTKFVASVRRQMQSSDIQENIIASTILKQIEQEDIRDSILVQLSWTHHRTIFSRCKSVEEREFYIRMSISENYSVRELDRQISASLFERTVIGNVQLSPQIREMPIDITNTFKDSYVLEFLNLPKSFSESDLEKGIIAQMKNFILELGKDFLFVDQQYKVQVGNSDFYIDLLFYHRGLQCLVAFELKSDKFKPEHLGQLNFYLEALDRNVKKSNENPSIGILLCKDKDFEVVEYALSRSLSPTMVAECQLKLPDKKLLEQKLHELFENSSRFSREL